MTYIREFDRATMIEIAPHCYLNKTAERALRLHHTSVTGLKHHEDKHDDDPIGPIERVTQMAKQFSDSTKHSDISAESTNSVDCSSLIPLRDRLAGLTFLHHHRRTAEADPCSLRAVWSG